MKKVWFTIDRYDHGCCGRKYASKLEAIKAGSWSIWTDGRVRKQFNLGQGTMADYERYCRNNNCEPVHEQGFWKIAEPLGRKWRENAEIFINNVVQRIDRAGR